MNNVRHLIIKSILDRLKKKNQRRQRPQIPIKEYQIYPEKDKNHQEDEERGKRLQANLWR